MTKKDIKRVLFKTFKDVFDRNGVRGKHKRIEIRNKMVPIILRWVQNKQEPDFDLIFRLVTNGEKMGCKINYKE